MLAVTEFLDFDVLSFMLRSHGIRSKPVYLMVTWTCLTPEVVSHRQLTELEAYVFEGTGALPRVHGYCVLSSYSGQVPKWMNQAAGLGFMHLVLSTSTKAKLSQTSSHEVRRCHELL